MLSESTIACLSESAFSDSLHYVKSVVFGDFLIRVFPDSNTKRYSVCGKIRTIKSSNKDTFHALLVHNS